MHVPILVFVLNIIFKNIRNSVQTVQQNNVRVGFFIHLLKIQNAGCVE